MSEETTALFEGIFALEDIREILRETAPKHELSQDQKDAMTKAIKTLGSSAKILERMI